MRTPREHSHLATTTSVLCALALLGCQGILESPPEKDVEGNSTNPGDGDSTDPMVIPGVDDPRTCVQGIPGTTQIPRLLNREYDAVVQDLLGVTSLASAAGARPSALLVPDYQGSMTDIAWNSYLVTARDIAAEVMAGTNRSNFITCDPAAPGCLTDTIRNFGRKAFRRPVTETEVESFERLNNLDPAGTPEEVAQAMLFAFLASPSFLLLPELSTELDGDTVKLSQHEVAARLSFMLWGSVPDQTLSAAADAGALATKEQIFEQAQRMVQDRAKTGPIVTAFHRQYALIVEGSRWGSSDHDTSIYSNYSADAVAPMMAEMDAFFETVAFESGTFRDLFLSNTGFVNQATAPLYGLEAGGYGPELARVEFTDGERPGFLTRAAFLSSYSNYATSSPILRGAFITERILGIEISSPPPGATDTPVPPGNYATQREVIEALTTPSPCGGCHGPFINPPGFVLEQFNSVGTRQINDQMGGPINSTAEVYFTEEGPTTVTSPLELMRGIADTAEARRRYAETWVSFATKRAPNSNDACIVEELSAKLSGDGYSILNLLSDLTQANSFTVRTLEN